MGEKAFQRIGVNISPAFEAADVRDFGFADIFLVVIHALMPGRSAKVAIDLGAIRVQDSFRGDIGADRAGNLSTAISAIFRRYPANDFGLICIFKWLFARNPPRYRSRMKRLPSLELQECLRVPQYMGAR